MPKQRLLLLLMAMTIGVTAGCSSQPQKVNLDVDPGVVALSKAADEISNSYRVLSYAESARASEEGVARSLDYDKRDFPEAWRKEIVLREDYYGELESFLRGLSKLVGYSEPQIVGRSPVIPITVAVNRSSKPLFEYLVDASYQAGGRARVILDGDMNRLQITYPE
ncbi:DotD/TraH family lipoprotein [Marinobacter gelidimuriae]|jgi:defect-in-organelle-trafficking protein DotD|uniref:DotD/TraH family lipoprotein n=1 Tax=Marinobacter gelidimuriae TaxID=2739064 RepID=UPI000366D23D|nr:DotD/TraH family lipoprotein [Marinobacter gelidimuriae]